MLEDIKSALREIIKEELEPRFERIDQRFERIDHSFEQVQGQLGTMQRQLDRMEESQQEDVVGVLKLMNGKPRRIEERDEYRGMQISLLNERVFKLETEVRQLIHK